MYSARSIAEGERIFYGDVVIQVEDYEFNQRLRRAYHGVNNESKAPWLLNSYYWDPSVSLAQTEASDVQSIVPGLGMLANSHTGLVNAAQMEPHQRDYHLHRAIDVGAGASSSYHDVHFDAEKDIQVGEEIFVRYGGEFLLSVGVFSSIRQFFCLKLPRTKHSQSSSSLRQTLGLWKDWRVFHCRPISSRRTSCFTGFGAWSAGRRSGRRTTSSQATFGIW
jgi:hypothetical protein